MLLGLVMLFILPSRPLDGNAWMLTPDEQQLVESAVSSGTHSNYPT